MGNKFDELAKGLAQSVTRRQALKRFGVGLAGMALACFGLANKAQAVQHCSCTSNKDCGGNEYCYSGTRIPNSCDPATNPCCCQYCKTGLPKCSANYAYCASFCPGFCGSTGNPP